jgi:hypothetical protein
MPCNDRLILLKKIRHLSLRQPNTFTFDSHLQPCNIIRLIDDFFIKIALHKIVQGDFDITI